MKVGPEGEYEGETEEEAQWFGKRSMKRKMKQACPLKQIIKYLRSGYTCGSIGTNSVIAQRGCIIKLPAQSYVLVHNDLTE